jgi:hypothetical protein
VADIKKAYSYSMIDVMKGRVVEMTENGLLIFLALLILLVVIVAVISVVSAVVSSIGGIVDDEEGEDD